MNNSTQTIKVDVKTPEGQEVHDAQCSLVNDNQSITVMSGQTTTISRSSEDLKISCKVSPGAFADRKAISRANGGMLGNIILGGGIGALIDHNRGNAYNYPTWVELITVKALTFDRANEIQGQPVLGIDMCE